MGIEESSILIMTVAVFAYGLLRAKRDSKIAALTDTELAEESYWAVQDRDYDNAYSRELTARKARKARATESYDVEAEAAEITSA